MVTAATLPPPQTATENTGSDPAFTRGGKRFRVSGQTFKNAIADLPPAEQDTLWWLFQYCHTHDLGRDELGTLLKKPNGLEYYSPDSIIQLLGGGRLRRGENIDLMLESIRAFRDLEDTRAHQVSGGFITTRLFFEIEKRCMKALERQRIMYIFGDSQIGKTRCLKEVQRRHNHGQTIYVECPYTGAASEFLKALGRALNIPASNKQSLADAIIATFDSRMLLIVDESHNALRARKGASGSAVMAFLRELWNRTQCGMVIAMTNEGRDDLLHGPHRKSYEQLWRRRITPLQLPNITPDDDLELFSAAYGLPPAGRDPVSISVTYIDQTGAEKTRKHVEVPYELQSMVNKTESLGVWIGILQDASDMAREKSKDITWGAVIKAACQARAEAEIYC